MKKHQENELFVMGDGEVEIVLEFHPDDVEVYFKPSDLAPCVPSTEDKVEWRLHRKFHHHQHQHHHHYVLVIKWDVESPRTIVWKVSAAS